MNRQDCVRYQEKAVSGIPEDFAGRLLEVPVGTGILTMPLYRTLPRAEITCLDYSPDMMAQAQEKARRMHLGNVAFRQGDVGALSFESGSFDAVLSLNGFHAFPDKEAGLSGGIPRAAAGRRVLRLLLCKGRVRTHGSAHPPRV